MIYPITPPTITPDPKIVTITSRKESVLSLFIFAHFFFAMRWAIDALRSSIETPLFLAA